MKELAWELGETSRIMRRYYDRGVAALGVTTAQWRVLLRLAREPGLKQVELAERMDVEPITACRIVDRLEEAGLVERLRDPEDRRAWRLELTGKALRKCRPRPSPNSANRKSKRSAPAWRGSVTALAAPKRLKRVQHE